MQAKQYELKVDPKILKFLGPTLYSNIYYVLAELIANAYDANAHNVYIIQTEDSIIVEDDGNGMSYESDVKRYLDVASETRIDEEDTYVEGSNKKRRRLGRKGIGKLAALSVSDKVLVKTIKNGDPSGFILSSELSDDHLLTPLPEKDIFFTKAGTDHGTSIVMTNPAYKIHDQKNTVKKNLLKILPLVSEDFRIHIHLKRGSEFTIDGFDTTLIKELGALITIGNDFHYLSRFFKSGLGITKEKEESLLRNKDSIVIKIKDLRRRDGELRDYDLEIRGWIGTLRSTRDKRLSVADFPDNFLSVISNGKLGNFNILPEVSRNKLQEVYVVGQLHVDLFEVTELPDMALSNRQGYKSDDRRYAEFSKYISEKLLPEVVSMRKTWGDYKNEHKKSEKLKRQRDLEAQLKERTEKFENAAAKELANKLGGTPEQKRANMDIIQKGLGKVRGVIGLKDRADEQKKRILISHCVADKPLADVVWKMLVFNGVSPEDILYTSSEDFNSQIPEGMDLLDYLREFFVKSISNHNMGVIYITSQKMAAAWFPVIEVGGIWITQGFHKVFNIIGHRPLKPLDTDTPYQRSEIDYTTEVVTVSKIEFNRFVEKVLDTCVRLGYTVRTKEDNETELARYVVLT